MKTAVKNNSKQDTNLTIRMDEELAEKLEQVCEKTGFDRSKIMRLCIKALVTAIEEKGEIVVPIRISVASERKGERRL